MPSRQVADNLSKVAALEVYKAAQHPGTVSNPVVWPHLRAAVRFELSAPPAVAFVVLLPNGGSRPSSKMEAVKALLKSWMDDLYDLELRAPGQYAQAVSIINDTAARVRF
jgi:hypothetical protein